MATQEEMLREGILREVKMMAVHHAAEMISELGMIAVKEGDERLLELCATFVAGAQVLVDEIQAVNLQAFQAFEAQQVEVDQLEAMLALGGEELKGGE